jgi:hypothetical protein
VTDCGQSGCRRFLCVVVDSCKFHDNLCSGQCITVGSRGKFACIFYILNVIWIKFDTVDAHSNLYGDHEFCENWYSDNHSLLQDVGEFVFVCSTFIV